MVPRNMCPVKTAELTQAPENMTSSFWHCMQACLIADFKKHFTPIAGNRF